MLLTSFLVEHNMPLSAADHAGALFKQMFPDSDIASKNLAVQGNWELINIQQRRSVELTNFSRVK